MRKELRNPFACNADKPFDTKVKCSTGRGPHLGQIPHRAKKNSSQKQPTTPDGFIVTELLDNSPHDPLRTIVQPPLRSKVWDMPEGGMGGVRIDCHIRQLRGLDSNRTRIFRSNYVTKLNPTVTKYIK